jgi:hypothetical protein
VSAECSNRALSDAWNHHHDSLSLDFDSTNAHSLQSVSAVCSDGNEASTSSIVRILRLALTIESTPRVAAYNQVSGRVIRACHVRVPNCPWQVIENRRRNQLFAALPQDTEESALQ